MRATQTAQSRTPEAAGKAPRTVTAKVTTAKAADVPTLLVKLRAELDRRKTGIFGGIFR